MSVRLRELFQVAAKVGTSIRTFASRCLDSLLPPASTSHRGEKLRLELRSKSVITRKSKDRSFKETRERM
jgi:hypothetical protein